MVKSSMRKNRTHLVGSSPERDFKSSTRRIRTHFVGSSPERDFTWSERLPFATIGRVYPIEEYCLKGSADGGSDPSTDISKSVKGCLTKNESVQANVQGGTTNTVLATMQGGTTDTVLATVQGADTNTVQGGTTNTMLPAKDSPGTGENATEEVGASSHKTVGSSVRDAGEGAAEEVGELSSEGATVLDTAEGATENVGASSHTTEDSSAGDAGKGEAEAVEDASHKASTAQSSHPALELELYLQDPMTSAFMYHKRSQLE